MAYVTRVTSVAPWGSSCCPSRQLLLAKELAIGYLAIGSTMAVTSVDQKMDGHLGL